MVGSLIWGCTNTLEYIRLLETIERLNDINGNQSLKIIATSGPEDTNVETSRFCEVHSEKQAELHHLFYILNNQQLAQIRHLRLCGTTSERDWIPQEEMIP